MEGEGLCECGYHSARPEGPFCPKCTSNIYIREPVGEPTSECEGLCLCSYKSAQPEGPFCPRCTLPLFLRHPLPRPGREPTFEGELTIQTQSEGHRHGLDNLSTRFTSGLVSESQLVHSSKNPTAEELNHNGDVILLVDGRRIRYTAIGTPGDMTPRGNAPTDLASHSLPTSRSNEPSNELDNKPEATPCDGANKSTGKEDSASFVWRADRLGQVNQGQRSRSPRRREDSSKADTFRHRSRSHQRPDTIQRESRAPLQELRGGNNRQRRQRRHNGAAKKAQLASAKENDAAAATSNALLPQSLPRALDHDENQPPSHSLAQQERLVTPVHNKPDSVVASHRTRSRPTPAQNNDNLYPPVDLVRLDAAIQQLLDEERARADNELSRKTADRQADENQKLLTVDDGLPQGHGTSRRVGALGEVSANSILLRQSDGQQPATLKLASAQIQPDWCLRCHRSGHRATTPCPNLMVERAVPKVQRDWSTYYRPNPAATQPEPVTVVHIINISHRLSLQFNQFNAYVTERDRFLHELDKYLKLCIANPSYEAWLACLSFCNTTVESYISCLLGRVNNLQHDVVLRTLFQAVIAENRHGGYFQGRHHSDLSERECARLMDCTRARHAVLRIDQRKYSMALESLNSERAAYMAKHRGALRRVEDLVNRNRDALRSKKIRVALSSLSLVMLDPGRNEKLNRISPMDFPLPRIRRLREDWNAIRDDEK